MSGVCRLKVPGKELLLLLLPFPLEFPAVMEVGTMTGGQDKPGHCILFAVLPGAAGEE